MQFYFCKLRLHSEQNVIFCHFGGIFHLSGRAAQTVECWCMQMGLHSSGDWRDPLVELWASTSQPTLVVKQNPPPVPASRLLNPTKHSFFPSPPPSKFRVAQQCRGVYRICTPGAEHCAQCNRVWGARSRFRCNPPFNFSIKGKGMAPALKLIWCPDRLTIPQNNAFHCGSW